MVNNGLKPDGGGGHDIGYSVQQTSDGGYIVETTKKDSSESFGNDNYDLWLIKTDSNTEKKNGLKPMVELKPDGGNDYDILGY